MTTIWKYKASESSGFLDLPIGAKPLAAQKQGGYPHLWAMVDPEAKTERRPYWIVGTGVPLGDASGAQYVGTFQMHGGGFVFHMFLGSPSS